MTTEQNGDDAKQKDHPPFKPAEIANSTEEDVRTAFSGPALASNRFFLSLVGSGVRIAFTEQHGKIVGPQFRTAVMISLEDAFALRDLLTSQLSNIQFIEVPPQDEPADADSSK